MKVLLVNSSARLKGNTYLALVKISETLKEEGIESEIFQLGSQAIADCSGCGGCIKQGKCVIDDKVNEFVEMAKEYDGFIFGTPVYYAHPSGRLLSFMDRVFYSNGKVFAFKPASAIAVARRAGTTASLDAIQKHFTINQMPIVSSTYWNNVYGSDIGEVSQDEEGMQTMVNLAKNMAWLLKCIELGKQNGVNAPTNSKKRTNFIR